MVTVGRVVISVSSCWLAFNLRPMEMNEVVVNQYLQTDQDHASDVGKH